MKIHPLSRKDEKRLLASVLCQLDGELPNSFWDRMKREIFMFFVGVIAVLILIIVAADSSWTLMFLTGSALIVGIAIGFAFWQVSAAAQWPAVAKCIDRSAVEARLRELDN